MNPLDNHNMIHRRWYSVKQDKPKVGQRVLVSNTAGYVCIAERVAKRRLQSYWHSDGGGWLVGVTHWAVLPSPAKARRPDRSTSKP